MKRKIISSILAVLLICILAVSVSAAGSASLSVSSKTVYRGSELKVVAKVSGVGQVSAGSVEVTYDSGLEWTGVTSKVNGVVVDYKLDKGRIIFYSMSSTKINGDLLELTFKVKNDAWFADNGIILKFEINGEKISASTAITVACSHKYGEWASDGAESHSHKCTICGKGETGSHSFDHDCDTTCDTCGFEREITHQFAEEWTSDETGHWHSCSVCGARSDEAEHVPGAEAGEYTDQLCTVCKYVMSTALGHTHKYDDTYESDENGHWKVCTGTRCGEATEAQPHVYDGNCDETCNDCGYVRQITHKDGEWEHNSASHWKTCTECSARLNEGEHSWDAGYVKVEANLDQTGIRVFRCIDCMAEREEVIPQTAITDPGGGLAWWIWLAIGAGGGVLLTSAVFIIIIVAGVNKKRGGRYRG